MCPSPERDSDLYKESILNNSQGILQVLGESLGGLYWEAVHSPCEHWREMSVQSWAESAAGGKGCQMLVVGRVKCVNLAS